MSALIELIGTFFYIAVFARVILSWIPLKADHPLVKVIYTVTEPILAPIRRVVPRFGMLDLSPMIALILVLFLLGRLHLLRPFLVIFGTPGFQSHSAHYLRLLFFRASSQNNIF